MHTYKFVCCYYFAKARENPEEVDVVDVKVAKNFVVGLMPFINMCGIDSQKGSLLMHIYV